MASRKRKAPAAAPTALVAQLGVHDLIVQACQAHDAAGGVQQDVLEQQLEHVPQQELLAALNQLMMQGKVVAGSERMCCDHPLKRRSMTASCSMPMNSSTSLFWPGSSTDASVTSHAAGGRL